MTPENQKILNDFLNFKDARYVCTFLNKRLSEINQIISEPEYFHFEIPKKKGGMRKISAPSKDLKKIQTILNHPLQVLYNTIKPNESMGFIKSFNDSDIKPNIIENARKHVAKREILNIDLKDFFNSITTTQVYQLFRSDIFKFNDNIAKALAFIMTNDNQLPTGAPTSPTLSNFICIKLDKELARFCLKNNLNYSRYADDLTFSSDNFISDNLRTEIFQIIRSHKFEINQKKVFKKTNHAKQTVTGIIVNEKLNIDRKYLKKVRAMLHDAQLNGIKDAANKHYNEEFYNEFNPSRFYNKLNGQINFIGQVRGKEDAIYQKFKKQLKNLEK